MPRLKKATDANGNIFYPITISKGVWDTDNNQRVSVTLALKQDIITVVNCTKSLLPATLAVNTYYNITDTVSTKTFTLPSMTNITKLSSICIMFTTGSSTPSIIITPASGDTVVYFSGYEIKSSTTYELNIMWNGTKWVVAYATIG